MKYRLAISTAIVSLMLAACSNAPSSADIKAAYERHINEAGKEAVPLVGEKLVKDLIVKVHDAKKIACEKADGNPGFRCDFEADLEYPIVGKVKKTMSARFAKGDSGWQMLP